MTAEDGTRPPPAQPGWAYFLDVDGTLIEIAERPDAVRVPGELIRLLDRLRLVTGGACALVSGRSIAALDGLFAPVRMAASGLHGVEWRGGDGVVHYAAATDPASAEAETLDRALASARMSLDALVRRYPALGLEDKGVTLALHYRAAPELEPEVLAATGAIVAARPELVAQPGKMVVELQPAGVDKGRAVNRFMAMPPFHGRRPVFVGDDLTDEHGFAAVNALDGISVCVGDRVPSAATYRLRSVGEALDWLAGITEERSSDRR
jgi:trehalose 6-phosphate phosphatase